MEDSSDTNVSQYQSFTLFLMCKSKALFTWCKQTNIVCEIFSMFEKYHKINVVLKDTNVCPTFLENFSQTFKRFCQRSSNVCFILVVWKGPVSLLPPCVSCVFPIHSWQVIYWSLSERCLKITVQWSENSEWCAHQSSIQSVSTWLITVVVVVVASPCILSQESTALSNPQCICHI